MYNVILMPGRVCMYLVLTKLSTYVDHVMNHYCHIMYYSADNPLYNVILMPGHVSCTDQSTYVRTYVRM